MNANSRPRQSLLSLFDPLTAIQEPSTPPRIDSPSAESDKENENPPRKELTLTTFFNRTYKPHHPLPKPLSRRLIDVGDDTVDDVDPWQSDDESGNDILDIDDFEDNDNDTLTFRKMVEAATPKVNLNRPFTLKTPSPSVPRMPFSELALEHEATPLARSKTLRKQPPPMQSGLAQAQSPAIVVRSASPRGQWEAEPSLTQGGTEEGGHGVRNPFSVSPNSLVSSVSSINISSPSAAGSLIADTVNPSISTPSANTIDENDLPTATEHRAHLRPNPPSTSSRDRNRCSVDLQNSFQFHLDDDINFDLLNDKVSFFNSLKTANGSYLDADSSFDMGFGDPIPDPLDEVAEAHEPSELSRATSPDSLKQHRGLAASKVEEELEPGKHASLEPCPEITDLFIEKARSVEAITPKQPRSTQSAPPPVVGLRIVKRSQLASQKPIAPKTTANSRSLDRRQSLASLPNSPVQPIVSRRDVLPGRRGAAPSQSTTGPFSRPRAGADEVRKTGLSRAMSTSSLFAGNGPRRIIVSDESVEKSTSRPASGYPGGGSSASLQSGPRRMAVSERPSISKGSMSGTGLKQPSSTSGIPKAPSRVSAGSSLPQPVSRTSRLPAPSIGVRSGGLPPRDTNRGIRRVV